MPSTDDGFDEDDIVDLYEDDLIESDDSSILSASYSSAHENDENTKESTQRELKIKRTQRIGFKMFSSSGKFATPYLSCHPADDKNSSGLKKLRAISLHSKASKALYLHS